MQMLINLISIVLWIQLLQFCRGSITNWKRIGDNNEVYPWLVQIKQKFRPEQHNKIVYGTLISHNAVITTREGIIGHRQRELMVETYCPKLNDKITNDCLTSDVSTIILESTRDASRKYQDPFAILILKSSFNGSYVRPLHIAKKNNIDENNCFFPIWPFDNPSDSSTRIDLHKTAHKVKIHYGSYPADKSDKNVINALPKEPYFDLLRFNYLYSDVHVPKMDGVPLVCTLNNNLNQVALIGPIPGYFLKACNKEKQDCRSIIYYIDLMSYSDDVMKNLISNERS